MNQSFKAWLRRVDAVLVSICGLSSADLADVCYYDMWQDGVSPREAAEEVLSENGFDMELLEG